MKKYNYKNCQSLFGYSAQVHIRCKGKYQLCGCGGLPLDFDLWRQMTVEHLIGKSQGGYLNQIRDLISLRINGLTDVDKETLAREIDSINTVTACQFCNSTTSRDKSNITMVEIFEQAGFDPTEILKYIKLVCANILESKQKSVRWKLESIREAYSEHVASKINIS